MFNRIDILRARLNRLVERNASYEKIYEISVKLDCQIVMYYKRLNFELSQKTDKKVV